MSVTNAHKVFAERIEAAIEEYMRSEEFEFDSNEMVVDWVVGYCRTQLLEDGDVVGFANSLISKPNTNPNGQVFLAEWVSQSISTGLFDDVEED